jgi:hypothetical protein
VGGQDDGVREWADEMIKAIQEGLFDKYLRGIVRAAYRRRDSTLVVPDGTAVRVAGLLAPTTKQPSATCDGPETGQPLHADPESRLPHLPVFTGKVLPTSESGSHTFEVDGKRYRKLDVIGLVFEPDNTFFPYQRGTTWRGVSFYVLEVNKTNVVAVMVRRPFQLSRALEKVYYDRRPITFPKIYLRPILG